MKTSEAGLSEAAKDYINNTIGSAAQDLKDNAAVLQARSDLEIKKAMGETELNDKLNKVLDLQKLHVAT